MQVRIIGTALPGTRFGEHGDVRVGVQRGREVVDAIPADAASVRFDLDVTVVDTATGPDFRGPYVHGRRGERFLYLVWTHGSPHGPVGFRRAKLQLAPVAALAFAQPYDRTLVTGALPLTGGDGGPVCASVRPPWIEWTAATA
ncbi:hypothetical protein Cs7R123_49750 [Catellatospora sp. TT07R-123]|uniref:DUF5990 family protein n=1 Tax=Catellatospora sp. TT07R-123 TaxID=2733863 RepID=UPI001B209688|nr:DUF5990 family protein [Catellatospora sp. TT07R-123]GHJ47633.1 hypothetical protein Cs7R123_49750 [Catellatospora sp. TT07R-123]